MDDFALAAFREREARQILKRRAFYVHAAVYVAVQIALVVIWALAGGGHPWFLYALIGWGIGLVAHGATAFLMSHPDDIVLQREQRRAARSGNPPT
ncbi:MAG: 2TM domain-containing protein [Acidimicrobiales bacterium]